MRNTNIKPKILLLLSLLIINSSLLLAQPGWIQSYEPFQRPIFSYSYDSGNIQVTDDGYFIVNGTCSESDDEIGWFSKFGFLIKFDPDGNIVWARKDSLNPVPPMWDCESETFTILPDGGFVSAGQKGWSTGYICFRDNLGNLENVVYYKDINYHTMNIVDNGTALLFAGSSGGATLQKTDLEGVEIWRENYVEYNSTEIVSVVQANDGGYAFLSFTLSDFDYCLVKTDAFGSVEWSQTYDYNSQNEIPNSMIQTSDGGYLLCGHTDHNPGTEGDGGFIVKTDAIGDTLWTKKYEPVEFYFIYNSVELDDGFILFGSHSLSKIDNSGDEIWYEELPTSGISYGEQPMQANEAGFICYMKHDNRLYLIQASEEGIVSITNHELPVFHCENLSCFPNPFNPSTTISYSLQNPTSVSLDIYNVKGQKVKTLVNDNFGRGIHEVIWNGRNDHNKSVASGVYFYKLKVNGEDYSVKKCLMLK